MSDKRSFEEIFSRYQKVDGLKIDENTVVAYQGVPGAFSEQATLNFFGEDIKTISLDRFEQVVVALENGECDYGVLPVENSSAGFVSGIYHLLDVHNVKIVGETKLVIRQALLGYPGATIDDIERVYSHPQGLMQSAEFLSTKDWQQVSYANTAMAAKKVKDEGDIHQAAIASTRAAKLYGLDVLNPCISFDENNATRFIVLSRDRIYAENADKICIQFALAHKSGTLYKILGFFYENDINMTSIESIPLQGRPWEYHFIVTVDGNLDEEKVQTALAAICEEAGEFHLLGNYM